MAKLQCGICGGKLVMDPSNEYSVCESCGTKYTVESMKNMLTEITGTVQVAGEVKVKGISDLEELLNHAGILLQKADNLAKTSYGYSSYEDLRRIVELYSDAEAGYGKITKKYPLEPRALAGYVKAEALRMIFIMRSEAVAPYGGIPAQTCIALIERLEGIKKSDLSVITDSAERQKIKKLCDEYIDQAYKISGKAHKTIDTRKKTKTSVPKKMMWASLGLFLLSLLSASTESVALFLVLFLPSVLLFLVGFGWLILIGLEML